MNMRRTLRIISMIVILALMFAACNPSEAKGDLNHDYSSWAHYGGTPDGSRYSELTEINKDNVKSLREVWRFSSRDKDQNNRSQNQCNPIIIDTILYSTSPQSKLLALNARTGKAIWIYDPAKEDSSIITDPMRFYKVNRGVAYWPGNKSNGPRLFYNVGGKIQCISAEEGGLIRSFGQNGHIDLSQDLDRDPSTFNPFVANTSPPIIFKDLLITGSRVAESIDAAPGHIRAYNVVTGDLTWIFHTIPHPGELNHDTWPDPLAYTRLGGANAWSGMSLDHQRGIVYIPLGSVSGDFYGGTRKGDNLYGNSLVALDAQTGKYIWHFQTVHHDLWDRDLPAPPNLLRVKHQNKWVDAVAQITKQGYVFLFDRTDGTPLFDIVETSVSLEALPGEWPAPTQPIPVAPPPFTDQYFSEDEVGGLSESDHKKLIARYRDVAHKELFHPPSQNGNWIFPGFDGGGEWGGAAVDQEHQIMYINSSRLPWIMEMIPQESNQESGLSGGALTYQNYCAACHGGNRNGYGAAYPELTRIGFKYTSEEIRSIINNGLNMMPGFPQIQGLDLAQLTDFLTIGDATNLAENTHKEAGKWSNKEPLTPQELAPTTPFKMNGYNRFLDDKGYPGIKPPWGTLTAIDLNKGVINWQVPLGHHDELYIDGIARTGTENYGGPLVTKGGIVVIGATKDAKLHIFDATTGDLLWEAELPAPAYATPATYAIDGRQYIVINCGGGKIGSPSGDEIVAFALE